MLHVVQTIASLQASKGGVSRTVAHLSRALAESADSRVSIISADPEDASDSGTLGRQDRPPRLHVLAGGRTFGNLRRLVGSGAPGTVVHDNGLWLPSNFMSAVAARSRSLPFIISPHGMLEGWALKHGSLRKRAALATYQRWCLKTAHAFHATSELEADNIRRQDLRQPIAVVGNGIENPPVDFTPVRTGARLALFLSRLHPKKGVLELIEAWRQVVPEGWKLRIVGPDEGGYRAKIAAAVAESGVAGTIELCDAATDREKWRHYAQAEVFILPTHSENFGLVIGEALACGVPVITTCTTPWKSIEDHGCGWIIEPTIADLCAAIRAATRLTPSELTIMGGAGRRWIPKEFSWNHIADQMRELYGWVVAGLPSQETPVFVHVK